MKKLSFKIKISEKVFCKTEKMNSIYVFFQHKVYCDTDDVPVELYDYIDEETFEKSKSYQIDKSYFGFISGLFSQIESTVRINPVFFPIRFNHHIIIFMSMSS